MTILDQYFLTLFSHSTKKSSFNLLTQYETCACLVERNAYILTGIEERYRVHNFFFFFHFSFRVMLENQAHLGLW